MIVGVFESGTPGRKGISEQCRPPCPDAPWTAARRGRSPGIGGQLRRRGQRSLLPLFRSQRADKDCCNQYIMSKYPCQSKRNAETACRRVRRCGMRRESGRAARCIFGRPHAPDRDEAFGPCDETPVLRRAPDRRRAYGAGACILVPALPASVCCCFF
jgi:hypothetical protein